VREAAEDIQDLRQELSSLGVDKLRADHLPEAGKELDAVVEETEKATNRIMESLNPSWQPTGPIRTRSRRWSTPR
jgi:chemotaxis protein CheZ